MAKPIYYPDWANNDVLLPSTGKTNKVRPREIIRNTGWDKGQIPTAEELNWTLNNIGAWVHYFADEFMPSVPETYLPKNGTTFELTGDLQGTVTWLGTDSATGNIQVVDNSHNHVSANISDAAVSPTVDVIPKRASDGALHSARSFFGWAPANNNFDYWFYDQTNQTQTGSLAWVRSGNNISLYLGTAAVQRSGVYLYGPVASGNSGYVEITNPRSRNGQEGQANSLVRFDYLTGQVNSLNAAINNVQSQVNNTSITSIRLGTSQTFAERSNNERMSGGVMTSFADFGSSNYQIRLRPLQYYINGNWYTAGYQ